MELALRAIASSSLAVTSGVDSLQALHDCSLRATMNELSSVRAVCASLVQNAATACRQRYAATLAVDESGTEKQQAVEGEEVDDSASGAEGESRPSQHHSAEEDGEAETDQAVCTQMKGVLQESSNVIHHLAQQNAALRGQLEVLAAESVPTATLIAAEARIVELEAENRTIAHQLSFLLHDQAADGTSGTVARSRSPPPVSVFSSSLHVSNDVAGPGPEIDLPTLVHNDLWESAVREMDEKASIVLMNLEEKQQFHEKDAKIASIEQQKKSVEKEKEHLELKLAEMQGLNRTLTRDIETYVYENGVLTQNLTNCLMEHAAMQQQLADLRGLLDQALAATASTTPHANKYLRGSEGLLAENLCSDFAVKTPREKSSSSSAPLHRRTSDGPGGLPQARQMPRNSLLGGSTLFKPLPGLPRLQTFADAEALCGSSRVSVLPATLHLSGVSRVPSEKESDDLFAPFAFGNIVELVKRNKELTQEVYRLNNFSGAAPVSSHDDLHRSGAEGSHRSDGDEMISAGRLETNKKRARSEQGATQAAQSSPPSRRDSGSMTDAVMTLAVQLTDMSSSGGCQTVPPVAPFAWQQLSEIAASTQLSNHCLSLLQSHCDLLSCFSSSPLTRLASADGITSDALTQSLRSAVCLASRQELELRKNRETITVLTARLDAYREELATCRNSSLCDAFTTAAAALASSSAIANTHKLSIPDVTAGMQMSRSQSDNLSASEWTHLEGLLGRVMESQLLLSEVLRRNKEVRADHAATMAEAAREDDADGDDDEGNSRWNDCGTTVRRHRSQLGELRDLLRREQEKTGLVGEQLHHERVAHRDLMEKVWQLEVSRAEAEAFAERARVEMAGMLSVEQYEQQAQDLDDLRELTTDLQAALEAAHGEEASLRAQLSQAQQDQQHLRDEHQRVLSSEEEEKRHLGQIIRRHADNQTELEGALINERRSTAEMHRAAEELRRALVAKDREISEAKQEAKKSRALLIEQVSLQEGALRGLFPTADATIADLLSLVKDVSAQRDALTAEASRMQLANRGLEQQLRALQLDLHLAQQERQQAVLVAQGLSQREAGLVEAHSVERDELQMRISLLEREMMTLQADKSAALEREEAMRVRVEALASDPISANVRKYGIAKTKLLQEQMDQLHARTVDLTRSLDKESQTVLGLRAEVKKLQGDLDASTVRENALCAARDNLARERELAEKKNSAAERSLEDLRQQLRDQTERLEETGKLCQSSNEAIARLKSTLADREQALSSAAAQLSTLGNDNVRLLDQVSGLVKEMEALEAQNRAQDSAIAHMKRGRGPHHGTRGGGGASSANQHGSSGAQRRASPTAPTSLTRAVPR